MLEATEWGGISGVAAILWAAAAVVALYILSTVKSLRIFLGTLSVILIALAFSMQAGVLSLPDFYIKTSGTAQILLAAGSIPMLLAVTLCAKYRRQSNVETTALSTSISGVVIADLEGKLQYSNIAFDRLVGETSENSLVGKQACDFIADPEQARQLFETVLKKGKWRGEIGARRMDGTAIDVQLSASLAHDFDGNPTSIVGSFVDLSVGRARDQELQFNRELLTNLVDSVSVVLWAADPDGQVTLAIGQGLDALREKSNQDNGLCGIAVGASIYGLLDDVVRLRQCFTKALSGEQSSFEWKHSDGITFETHLGPRTNSEGMITGVIGVSLNISARVTAEDALKRNIERQTEMEQQLERAQRLEAVGRLTGGIAHDFNNLLTTILGNVDLLTEQVGEHPELRKFADSAARAAGRGADLTQRLLAFSRQQALKPQATDVSELSAELTEMLRRTLPESITIETAFDDQPVFAMVDPSQLENALLNLALNARDAMPHGGILRISTTADHARNAIGTSKGAAKSLVGITVTDTGTGMSPAVVEKAFEPFFTTKRDGLRHATGTSGSGLGLSMVYGFVTQSKGHVHIDSTPGNGTSVTLLLPWAEVRCDTRDATSSSFNGVPTGTETILVLEDDPDVADFVVNALEHLGYDVLIARDGVEALGIADAGTPIDLLVSDVVLPGTLTGPAVANRIVENIPSIRVLFTSGYVADDIRLQTRQDGEVELLSKPYTVQALAHKVREVLEDDPGAPPQPARRQTEHAPA